MTPPCPSKLLGIASPGEETLDDACCVFGEVLDAKVALDSEGRSRGFAFVSFAEGAPPRFLFFFPFFCSLAPPQAQAAR